MIKAPYNFVPIHDRVYFPDWADKISHDVPFSDGESGTIRVTLTAHSPVFVRNGSSGQNQENNIQFSNIDGRYFIPGTSIKGMVRSVLEIMSFGKLGNVTEWTPTFRDLSNSSTGKKYKKAMSGVRCGWLKISPDAPEKYEIQDCGEPRRISHKKIDEKWGTDFAGTFSADFDAEYKKAEKKMDDLKNNRYNLHDTYTFKVIDENVDGNVQRYEFFKKGDLKGKLVVTGQPGKRNEAEGKGKHLEFIFVEPEAPSTLPVSEKVFNNFRYAYYDEDPKNESADWKYWKCKLNAGESIPVFFKKNNNGDILHFGLSYLYKLPYPYGIGQAVENLGPDHRSERLDLPESMFGTATKKSHLRGRVFFSPAFARTDTANPLETQIRAVLGTPKPSYYPTYIKGNDGYHASDLQLAGRKRYPVHRDQPTNLNPGTENISTEFVPLNTGVVFDCLIRFHNLRGIEIGALFSALTFHGNNGQLFHSIGMGKPLGFGKIKIEVIPEGLKHNIETYMNAFVKDIETKLNLNWFGSDQILELLTMAKEQHNSGNSELAYMKLNEFAETKEERLLRYSKYMDKYKSRLRKRNCKFLTDACQYIIQLSFQKFKSFISRC
jgi:CRISPR-associated protein (TIGR03986 family)